MANVASSDGIIFAITSKVMKEMGTIRRMIEILGPPNAVADENFISVAVSSDTLRKVIRWCEHYVFRVAAMVNAEQLQMSEVEEMWEVNFFHMSNEELCEIIEAATYLDIPALLERTSEFQQSVAEMKAKN